MIRQFAFKAALNFLRAGIRVAGPKYGTDIAARLVEGLPPVVEAPTPHGSIRFYCPGELPVYRARTLLSKEPETIEWIDSFKPTDTLWDIGANVGVYSLYAAKRGVRTVAFEPAAQNYYLLNRNIEINGLDDKITALCVALSDTTNLGKFHMQNTELAGALNSFDEARDWKGDPFESRFEQGAIGYDIDTFMQRFDPPFPNHIKIDVDGIEAKIIEGARGVLSDPRVESVLSELDGGRESYVDGVVRTMRECGLELAQKGHFLRVAGRTEKFYIYIFKRSRQLPATSVAS